MSKWADPTAAGMYLVGIICPGFWAVFTGAVDTSGLPLLGAWLIVFGVAWYILATISFAQGNLFGGTLNCVFGAAFGMAPGLDFAFRAFLNPVAGTDPRITSYLMFATAVVFVIMALAGSRIYWHLGCILLVPATILVIAGLVFIGAAPAKLLGVAGWLALVVSAYFLYTASALVLNAMFERQVLPLGRSSETYTG